MKKYLLILVAALSMVACDKKGPDKDVKFETVSASEGIAGTYNGTWTYIKNTETPVTVQGSIVFTATDDKYVANIAVASADGNLNLATVTNVVHANEGYQFYNNVGFLAYSETKNGQTTNYYAPFSGEVLADKSITIQFAYELPNGRKKDKFAYTFVGGK